MKVYISGPVTGLPDENREAFSEAKRILEFCGYDTIVPHDYVKTGSTWEQAMKDCIRVMMDCDAVYLLDGWKESRGANAEFIVAALIGMPASDKIGWLKS